MNFVLKISVAIDEGGFWGVPLGDHTSPVRTNQIFNESCKNEVLEKEVVIFSFKHVAVVTNNDENQSVLENYVHYC